MKNYKLHHSVYSGKHTLKADIVFVVTVYRGNFSVASFQKPTVQVFQQAVTLRQFPFNYAVVFCTKF